MSSLRRRVAFSAVFAVVVAGGQAVAAVGAPPPSQSPSQSPSPSPSPPSSASPSSGSTSGKAQRIAAEQSRAVASGRALGVDAGEKLVVKDVITDPDGSTSVRYNRTYDGLRVIGGDFVSHRDESGKIKGVTWNGSPQVAVASTTPKVSLASAKTVGLRRASQVHEDTSATKGELVVYSGGASAKTAARLAYDVLTAGVRADQTPSRLHTIVDANTGATLASFDEIRNGTGNGIYSGMVTIGTTPGPVWTMRGAAGNETADLNGATSGAGTTFTNATDFWGNGAVTDRASAGVDAHYGAERTFDYFKNVLGRNGIWNNGVGVRSLVHYGTNYVNAYWDGGRVTYGDGVDNIHPLTALDTVAHENSHGVDENTAALVGAGESWGLSEASADIFGTAVEFYANNASDTPDYLIGEKIDINGDGTPLRYMDEPSRDGASVNCWTPTVGSLDGHYSSGPLNHWFYLASEGSGAKVVNGVSYNSPTCDSSTVSPIGREQAVKIWYRTLSVYLTSSSTYAAAREGAIQSAKDLYGVKSPECTGVAASFSAIGVPQGAATCGITPPPPAGSNLLSNPGFESGNTLWSATPDVIAQWDPDQPTHSGTWNAWLGGYGTEHYDSISQLVTIPASTSATLSYYVHIDTEETTSSDAYDTMTVKAGSTMLQTLSNLNAADGYQLKVVNLSAYAGRTISLSFSGAEDYSSFTSFVLDDLSVNAAPRVTFSPLDFTGDGKPDIMRVTPTGELYLYRGNGLGGFTGAEVKIGSGWGSFVSLFSPGDFTGDRRSDLLAVRSNGDLVLYRGSGLGGFIGSGVKIGSGWASFVKLFSPGDFTGDGKSDVLAVRSNSDLVLYRGNGLGRFTGSGVKIGSGWASFDKLFSPGDFTGDRRSDVLAVNSNGNLYLYRGNGLGGFMGSVVKIGSGM